ncbi:MAG: transporter substrate-binding domain-containing protein [Gemmataceae bacterium]|nr:transporter substrate-binding domain-containing protein [Gemmataceae bacterium]
MRKPLTIRTIQALIRFALLVLILLIQQVILAQDKGALKCGTDFEGGIPYIFGDKDDPRSLVGFEVDLLAALEQELGRPIDRKHAAFDSLLPTVRRGDVDFVMNGIEITVENRKQADFTRPYYLYQLQLIARGNETRKFTTLEDCEKLKLRVGTLNGSAAFRVLDATDDIVTKGYDDQEGPFKDLVAGKLDALLFDVPIALYYVIQDNKIEHRKKDFPGLKLVGRPFAEGQYGIAVKPGSDALRAELDAALGRVIQSGEMKRILTKWHLWSLDQYQLYDEPAVVASESSGLAFGQYFVLLLKGAWVTIQITIVSMALAVALGLPLAMMRLYGPLPLRWLATGYIEFFRGIPVLLLLFFLYFGLSELIGVNLDAMTAAILGFGLNYAAYEAEIYRGGIQSIPLGQWEASASLGMSSGLTFRRIILPQSIRVILPPMTNDFIALFKDTSVVSIISVIELSKQYQILTKTYGQFLEIGLTTAALYLIMSVPLGYLSRYLEERWGGKAM